MIIHNPILTGSFTVNGTDVASITSSAASITAINSYTASQNILNGTYATTGSNTFKNPQTINSNLIVTGSITAQTLVVQTVSSSVIYSSGSNVFGNASSNNQIFTGSLYVTGAFYVTTGSVGIGTTSPADLLEVKGGNIRLSATVGVGPQFNLYSNGQTSNHVTLAQGFALATDNIGYLYNRANADFVFGTNNAERMRIQGNGLVGIGTSSPAYFLDVLSTNQYSARFNSSAAQGGFAAWANNGTAYGYVGNAYHIVVGGAIGDMAMAAVANMVFSTGGSLTERMRITSGGYTKISNNGTYSYIAGTIHELRQSAADYVYYSVNTNAVPYGVYFDYTAAAPNGTGNSYIVCADTAVTRFAVRSNGGIYNYQTYDVNLSDERTKKDIIPLESYWNKFKAIEIVKFKYKDQTHDDFNIGVIAQQVEKVAPEFIDEEDWAKPGEESKIMKAIYTADLNHATIKVLQEAMAKIETLQAQITELKNK